MTAKSLKVGEIGVIKELDFDNNVQHRRMMDLGFIPDTEIKCCLKTFGITAFEVKGSKYGVRNKDAKLIILK